MKLNKEFTKLEKSAVKLTVTVEKSDVQETYKTILDKYVKNAQIPGFRKGHVPAAVLERKFSDALKQDALSEIIDKSLNEVFENEKENRPLPYAQPVMEQFPELNLDSDLSYTVTFDVFPKIEVKDFSGITVKEPQVEITDKDIERELTAIQERNAVVMDKKDSETVAKDDIVTINYSELDENDKEIEGSKREGFVFTVGTGENIYKIDDEIIGMKKNETKQITKTYSKDEKDADLAGKTKKISVTVTSLKIRNLPALDDELAQDVNEKFKTLEDLKNDIKRSLETAKNRKISELKNNSLLSQLVEKNPFDIPVSMLQAELDGRWRMMAQQFQTTPEQLEKMVTASGQTKETMLEQWTGDSEKMLKSRIIVDSLIREKNISVTPEEIEEQYAKIAQEGGISVDEVKKHYSDPRTKEYLIDDTKENKLYDEIYKTIKVSKGDKVNFEELFQMK
ncbi:MAG: trigger factor [Spirochaetia bacterium]|nr:trigger factor [Spirochaetia bacterium]MDY4152146.1 trigger factor [Treponema sp.]MCI6827562.1 trigger factor [Spirochaetia bacterium]MCI7109557.1 trigger factor [Spirochaetia bacterium]MCI7563889.1 trigger factor [Spirochaetia bacterium]